MENTTNGIKFPLMIKTNDRMKRVIGYISSEYEPFRDGKGYISDDRIWIFSRKKPNTSEYPYFWYEDGEIRFGKVRDSIKDDFTVDKLVSLDLMDTVYKLDPNEPLYDEQMLNDINASTSMFIPEIRENDDCLKKLIKMSIINKKINVNGLKSKLAHSYSLSNLKTALMNNTKMSIPNFIVWCDLLELKFDIIVDNTGLDDQFPLPKMIHYSSETDSFTND